MGIGVLDSLLPLVCHPNTPSRRVGEVTASVRRTRDTLELSYAINSPTEHLALPERQKPCRTDGLWERTCFELFVRRGLSAYDEFNFSPSEQWAAYGFSSYREGRKPLALDTPPTVNFWDETHYMILSVFLEMKEPGPLAVGLSAVVEEADGTKSYWALAHPRSGTPDFHDPACFVLELPPWSPPSSPRT